MKFECTDMIIGYLCGGHFRFHLSLFVKGIEMDFADFEMDIQLFPHKELIQPTSGTTNFHAGNYV